MAFVEIVHACWLYRNTIVFEKNIEDTKIVHNIQDIVVVHRLWLKPQIRNFVAKLLLR